MPSNGCHRLRFAFAIIPLVTTLAHAEPVCRSFARAGIPGDAAISALPDGTVWYANRSGNRLMRVNPDRTLTPFVPNDATTSGLSGIAIGPDGNIWYTKDAGNRIGRIPPGGGQGVEFEPPEKNSFPAELVADRTGQLWFTARVQGYVGRLGTDGSVTVHRGPPLQARPFAPLGMTLGPDGNLWITDLGHNAIYRFEITSATFKRFDIPTPTAHPGRITSGADGNLWFTMTAARRIGRITPGGVITEFELGELEGGAPRDVVATADGALWFTTSGRRAGRILPNGTVETFRCSESLGTALRGPGGRPWFFGGDKVVTVDEVTAPLAPRPVATAPVTGSPWPVAGGPPAAPSPISALSMRDAIERLRTTQGRVVLQLTSADPNCTFCLPANATLETIAARRATDARYWRVSYEPWQTAVNDPDVTAAGIRGLPIIVVFVDGTEVRRIHGTLPAPEVERQLFAAP